MTKKGQPSFEKALERLEEIVEKLEDPDVTLDQTLALFQEGKRLSDLCRERLAEAEQRVSRLLEDAEGKLRLEDFEEDEDEE
ncbi:exodeoxyribonuclease VII small subunit [Candidatus Sumerlaeota bacterium]|nr:exodeoxyribonuclease VII small subunit [Candidatus Sumerlaeota bacterium]